MAEQTKEESGIGDFHKYRLAFEVRFQCELALLAYEMLQQSQQKYLEVKNIEEETKDQLRRLIFLYIHAFLSHYANVSKIFWPAASKCSTCERGKIMQKEFVLGDSFQLKRTLRDHLEHWDERIDTWAENRKDGTLYLDLPIDDGTLAFLPAGSDTLRRYRIVDCSYFLLGKKYPLRQMFSDIRKIYAKADAWKLNRNS